MKKDAVFFAKKIVRVYIKKLVHFIVFLPYFFSVFTLLRTLFYPWKNMTTKKNIRGFSFQEWLSRAFLNFSSRGIGFFMRSSIIVFFLIVEFIYICSLPLLIVLLFITVLPIKVGLYIVEPSEEEVMQKQKELFITSHCLKKEHQDAVHLWFTALWDKRNQKILTPPLARDWAFGYTPTLDRYVDDLTSPSYQASPRHIVGRKRELKQIEEVLSKSAEANVILVGDEGVGKHTVVDALAKLVYEGQIGKQLSYKRILKLNMEKILTTCTDPKQRESLFEDLLFEANEAGSIILVIENIDKYISYGEGRVDLTTPLEKFANHSHIQFIGITSPFFYQRFVFANEKINRLFIKIDVLEISRDEALGALLETIPSFERTYRCTIPYETALAAIEKSEFYITYIPFPEKAIDLLDSTCAHVQRIQREQNTKGYYSVTPEYIDTVLSEKTHIPTSLTDDMRSKLLGLESLLSERVLFQEEAISALSAALRRSFILLGKRKKPLATFLFLGSTGIGKTETAKSLASLFFGAEKYLTRFDMSLYQSKEDIKTLVGSLESGMPGLLSKAIREQPFAVLLLDELEKAHPDLINIFLTVIDEGYFVDGFGKRVDCKNLIIIATSNAGADYTYKQQQVLSKLNSAISSANEPRPDTSNSVFIDYLIQNKIYSPEFLNRFDGVIVYKSINEDSVLVLAKKVVAGVQKTLYSLYKIHISVSDETLKGIIKKGFNPAFGARNLEHIITQELEDKVASLILQKNIHEEETILL